MNFFRCVYSFFEKKIPHYTILVSPLIIITNLPRRRLLISSLFMARRHYLLHPTNRLQCTHSMIDSLNRSIIPTFSRLSSDARWEIVQKVNDQGEFLASLFHAIQLLKMIFTKTRWLMVLDANFTGAVFSIIRFYVRYSPEIVLDSTR